MMLRVLWLGGVCIFGGLLEFDFVLGCSMLWDERGGGREKGEGRGLGGRKVCVVMGGGNRGFAYI